MSSAVASPVAKAPATLSTSQMVQLMRLETDRATQHAYPISSLMIGLEGFDLPEESGLRRRLMPAVFGELKLVTFETAVRGLGLTQDQFILALFPHTTPERAQEVGEKLLARAAKLQISGMHEGSQVRLSIGIGHNQHPGTSSFESLIEEAEIGVHLAHRGGGHRCLLWRNVETEIDRLRGELEREIKEIAEASETFTLKRKGEGAQWGRSLVEKAIDLFDHAPEPSASLVRMQREVVALITSEVDRLLGSAVFERMAEKEEQIDLLERRIRKLTQHLDLTESELKRVGRMKSVDMGVASIYTSVQGLDGDEGDSDQKKEMLKTIFEANLIVRDQIASRRVTSEPVGTDPGSTREPLRPDQKQVAQP